MDVIFRPPFYIERQLLVTKVSKKKFENQIESKIKARKNEKILRHLRGKK
jgi:hypothetical protein